MMIDFQNPRNYGQFGIIEATYRSGPAVLVTPRPMDAHHGRMTAMASIAIPLHSRKYPGLHTIIDEEDFDLVNQHRWHVSHNAGGCIYAYAQTSRRSGRKIIYLHRLIAHPSDDQHVDHANGDGLDNRRSNLRVCQPQQNARNRTRLRSNSTGYVGVEVTREGRFRASVYIGRRKIGVGTFKTAPEAALARDDAARREFGEFARFNFPRPDERGV